jgi:hypothetical protein
MQVEMKRPNEPRPPSNTIDLFPSDKDFNPLFTTTFPTCLADANPFKAEIMEDMP